MLEHHRDTRSHHSDITVEQPEQMLLSSTCCWCCTTGVSTQKKHIKLCLKGITSYLDLVSPSLCDSSLLASLMSLYIFQLGREISFPSNVN